jgi:WD40 repeat protein/serine/threonine protein kinase
VSHESAPEVGSEAGLSPEQTARVIPILEEFLAELERGGRPRPEDLLARHPDLAAVLEAYLERLEVLHLAALNLREAPVPVEPAAGRESAALGQLGDFRLVREVGRGGMGVVYEAEQISLGRRVAFKVLPLAATLDPKQLQRFKHEAQAAAHLHHTNIVPVYAVGCERGVHYYAMQFIDGQTLAAVIRELRQQAGLEPAEDRDSLASGGRQPPGDRRATQEARSEEISAGGLCPATRALYSATRELYPALGTGGPTPAARHGTAAFFRTVAHLGVQAAEALEHAHQQGIVHRDIKPANLLVDAHSHLWVTDFGLARCHGDTGLTRTGEVLGTLRYMSPEQAQARPGLVDHRTDVYSLGATLYELLALEPPFPGSDRRELQQQIALQEPRPLGRRNRAVPAGLETIVLKALAKGPDDRYATAQELADDLRRWLAGEPIRARPVSAWQRGLNWLKRRPAAAALLLVSVVAALALGGAVLALGYNGRLQEAVHQAEQARQAESRAREREAAQKERAEAALALTRLSHYFHRIALAEREVVAHNVGRAEQLLDECPPELRHWEWHYVKRLCHPELLTLPGHADQVDALAFSADGQKVTSVSRDGAVKVWDAATGRQLRAFTLRGHPRIWALAVSADGSRLATSWGSVKVYDTTTEREILHLPVEVGHNHRGIRHATATSLAFSPDGHRLAAGNADGSAKVWDTRTGQETLHVKQPFSTLRVAFSADGRRLVTTSSFDTAKVWDVATGQELLHLAGHTGLVVGAAFSPDGQRLAVVGGDRRIKVWNALTGQEVLTLPGPANAALAFSPDGRCLASTSMDKTVRLWDVMTGQEIGLLRGHAQVVSSLAFSADGKRLVSGSRDGAVKIWEASPRQEPWTLRQWHAIRGIVFSPDGRHLALVGGVRAGQVVDAVTGHEKFTAGRFTDLVQHLAFSPDGQVLACASRDGTVQLCDARTGQAALTLNGHARTVHGVAFSPDGQLLASASQDGTVRVWDATSAQELFALRGHDQGIAGVAFSPDGARLASASWDKTVKIWDLRTACAVVTFQAHTGGVTGVAFSPDGVRVASAGQEGTVKVWDTAIRQEVFTLRGHTGAVHGVAFSPDGKRLVSASADQTVKIWDPLTGQEVLTLRGHSGPVYGVAFSADGTRLASASGDNTVKVWEAAPPGGASPPVSSNAQRTITEPR